MSRAGAVIPNGDAAGHAEPPRSRARLWIGGAITVLAVALFTALGVWQLERRVWKLALIDRVEQRVHAEPVAAPGPAEWAALDASNAEYRRVSVSGQFLNDRDTLVRATTAMGPGFWVLTPLRTDDGFIVLVNRGFVPPERRDPATRAAGNIAGHTTLTGLLRMTEPEGAFLRSNDPGADRWYSRDVGAISAARGLSQTAPYFIDAESTAAAEGAPAGGLTVVAFYNHHLLYAFTWFTLAVLFSAQAALAARRELALRR